MSLNNPGGGGEEGSRREHRRTVSRVLLVIFGKWSAVIGCSPGNPGHSRSVLSSRRALSPLRAPSDKARCAAQRTTVDRCSPHGEPSLPPPPTPSPIRRGVRRNAPQAIGALSREPSLPPPPTPIRSSAVCGATHNDANAKCFYVWCIVAKKSWLILLF